MSWIDTLWIQRERNETFFTLFFIPFNAAIVDDYHDDDQMGMGQRRDDKTSPL
jgi:hypothetical protein